MISRKTNKLKKPIFILLTAIFALGVLGVAGSVGASSVNLSGVNLEPNIDNILTYSEAGTVAGFKCIFDKQNDLSFVTDKANFYCEWNKILQAQSSVSYSIKYNYAEHDSKSGRTDYIIKTDGPYTNAGADTNDKIRTKDLEVVYLQKDTLAGAIRPEIKLIVRFTDAPGGSSLTEAQILAKFNDKIFKGDGSGVSFRDNFTNIAIDGDDTLGRPNIIFKLTASAKLTGSELDDANIFYFYAEDKDKYPNLAIRMIHDKSGSPVVTVVDGNSFNVCYTSRAGFTGTRSTTFVIMKPADTTDVPNPATNTTVADSATIYFNNDSYFEFFKKYYNNFISGKCPLASSINDESLNDIDAKPNEIKSTTTQGGGGGDLYEIGADGVGHCTSATYDGKNITQLITPIQGVFCYLGDSVLNGLQMVFNWAMYGDSGASGDPSITAGEGGMSKQLIINNDPDPTKWFSGNTTVRAVWGVVRDLINSLFLVVFLFSILVTVLKIESAANLGSWQMKKMIPTIVMTMILVNFSLAIANFVIAAMDAMVATFGDVSDKGSYGVMFSAENATIMGLIIRILFATALTGIVLYLSLLVWIRRYIILFLFMGAAVPYIGNVVPVDAVKGITKFWWENFFKWAFMGPMITFFLYVASVATLATTSIKDPNVIAGADVESGLSMTSIILTILVYYLAATVPLKLGGAVMSGLQKATTGKVGKAATRYAGGVVGAKMKVARHKAALRDPVDLSKESGFKNKFKGAVSNIGKATASGAITAGRLPGIYKTREEEALKDKQKAFAKAASKRPKPGEERGQSYTGRLERPSEDAIKEEAKKIEHYELGKLRDMATNADGKASYKDQQAALKALKSIEEQSTEKVRMQGDNKKAKAINDSIKAFYGAKKDASGNDLKDKDGNPIYEKDDLTKLSYKELDQTNEYESGLRKSTGVEKIKEEGFAKAQDNSVADVQSWRSTLQSDTATATEKQHALKAAQLVAKRESGIEGITDDAQREAQNLLKEIRVEDGDGKPINLTVNTVIDNKTTVSPAFTFSSAEQNQARVLSMIDGQVNDGTISMYTNKNDPAKVADFYQARVAELQALSNSGDEAALKERISNMSPSFKMNIDSIDVKDFVSQFKAVADNMKNAIGGDGSAIASLEKIRNIKT